MAANAVVFPHPWRPTTNRLGTCRVANATGFNALTESDGMVNCSSAVVLAD